MGKQIKNKKIFLSLLSTAGIGVFAAPAIAAGLKSEPSVGTFDISGENSITILAGTACESGLYRIENYSSSLNVDWTVTGNTAFSLRKISSNHGSACIIEWNNTVQAGNFDLTLSADNGVDNSSITINVNAVSDLTPYQINCPSSSSIGYGVASTIVFSVSSAIAGGTFTVKSLNSASDTLPTGFELKTDSATQSELLVNSSANATKGNYNFAIDYSVSGAIIDTAYLVVKINEISHFTNPQPIIFIDKTSTASSIHSTSFVTDADDGSNIILVPHTGSSLPTGVTFNTPTKQILVNRNAVSTGQYFVDVVWNRAGYLTNSYTVEIDVDQLNSYSSVTSCTINPGETYTLQYSNSSSTTVGNWSASSTGSNFIPTFSSVGAISSNTLQLRCDVPTASSETINVFCTPSSLPTNLADSSLDANSLKITKTLSASLYQYTLAGENDIIGTNVEGGSSVAGWTLSGTTGFVTNGTWKVMNQTFSTAYDAFNIIVPSSTPTKVNISWGANAVSSGAYSLCYFVNNERVAAHNFNLTNISLTSTSPTSMKTNAGSTNGYGDGTGNFAINESSISSIGHWTSVTSSADGYFTGSISSNGSMHLYTVSNKTYTGASTVYVNYSYTNSTSNTYIVRFPVGVDTYKYTLMGETSVVAEYGVSSTSDIYTLTAQNTPSTSRWMVYKTGTTTQITGISMSSVSSTSSSTLKGQIVFNNNVAVSSYTVDVCWQTQTSGGGWTTEASMQNVAVWVGSLGVNATTQKVEKKGTATVKATIGNLPLTGSITSVNTSTNKFFTVSDNFSGTVDEITIGCDMSKSYVNGETIAVTYTYKSSSTDPSSQGKTYTLTKNFTAEAFAYTTATRAYSTGLVSMYKTETFTWSNVVSVTATDGGDVKDGHWEITNSAGGTSTITTTLNDAKTTSYGSINFSALSNVADETVITTTATFYNKFGCPLYQKQFMVTIAPTLDGKHTKSGIGGEVLVQNFYTYREVGANQYFRIHYDHIAYCGSSQAHHHEYDKNGNAEADQSLSWDQKDDGYTAHCKMQINVGSGTLTVTFNNYGQDWTTYFPVIGA